MKDIIKGIAIFIGLFAIIVGIVFLGATVEKQRNEEIYNDGVCTNCGGHYKFVSAAKTRSTTTTTYYYYQCDNCEKIIELRH